ncbi:sensor histidine kinase [Fuscovulum ytuae]|uniref:histidine kinase n=1 Tax=Fuscovulum ytuae TaxID=3042299 RepID=A0ABY8QCB7_9RHOB|nr:sensor histidine kinase [Fuscovulum sp. YMD61]WGV17935.1 sensor histidine kinase N-terminal domain-containing protein [Fuscovulum sp. YMD61]
MTALPVFVRGSLRRRLLGWLLVSTLLLGLIALADTWAEARRTAQGVSDRVLAGSTLAIAERVSVDLSGVIEVDIPYSALDMLASAAEDQVFYRVDGPDGFLTGYDGLALAPRPDGADTGFADGAIGDTRLRIATRYGQVSTGEDVLPFSVTVAESTRARDALAQTILVRSALRLTGLAAGAALIVWIIVTITLRPLDRLARTLAARAPDDLSPLEADIPSEVAGPIEAMNSFMARLDGAVAALRNFTGNAGHQLRTPLATVRAQLALIARGGPEGRDGIAKAEGALIRAERVLAQLLMLARIDATAARRALPATDIAAIARTTTAEAIPEATRFGHDLGYEGDDHLIARADPVLCAELLTNLVDNAIRYAGPRATITVRARHTSQGPVLEVEDDGPGLPPDAIPRLIARQDLRADASQGTHGLGLAVVAEIARLFGAALDFAPATSGKGHVIRCRFPQPDAD